MGLSLGRLQGRIARCTVMLLVVATNTAAASSDDAGIRAALAAPTAEQRESALDQLIAAPDVSAATLSRIASLLDDRDLYVAGKAASALAAAGVDAFDTLERTLAQGTAQQRWAATVALYQSHVEIDRFVPTLARQLAQDDERLVIASLAALAHTRSRGVAAVPELRTLLSSPRADVRRATLVTLGSIGPPARAAVPEITASLRDARADVRLAAAAAMQSVVPPTPISDERFRAYLAWLQQQVPVLMKEHHVPGVSIAIIQEGRVRWAQGFGVRDARRGDPVTTETIFEACSMSKPVLALSALQLIQQGRLDLDTPLTRYLGHDYLRDEPGQHLVTARMVLTHRTGLPNWRAGDDEMGGPLPMLLAPGSEYTYSGEAMLFLQRAVEAIAGMSLDRFANQGLFEPLGLKHTSYVWTPAIEQDLASGHREDGGFKDRTHYRKANGAYSLYTTPTDYAALMLSLMRPESLGTHAFSPGSVELMLQRAARVDDGDAFARPGLARAVATYRALGWSIDVGAEGDIVQHSGSNSSGFRTFGQFNRAKGSGLVIFTNGDVGARVRDAILAQVGDR